jgi:hypothetical protein
MQKTLWLLMLVFFNAAMAGRAQTPSSNAPLVSFERTGAQDYCAITGGVKSAQLIGFDFDGRQVLTSDPLAGPNIRWPLTDAAGQPLAAGKYLVLVEMQLFAQAIRQEFRLVKTPQQTQAMTMNEAEANPTPKERVELTRLETLLVPDRPESWLRYGAALHLRWQTDHMVKVNGHDVRELGVDKARLQTDAPIALAALRKALDMSGENCELKKLALSYLDAVTSDAGEGTWELRKQRLALPCETPQAKAQIWVALGQREWGDAFAISSAYARKGTGDPFHARRITDAVQREQFDRHVAEGLRCLDEALALAPNHNEALLNKSLLLREKVKITFALAERRQYTAEADRLNDRAVKQIAAAQKP